MSKIELLIGTKNENNVLKFKPTTLKQLELMEEYLEDLIINEPEILHLVSRDTGIYGPFIAFKQLHLKTNQNKDIYPDIIFLTQSGHIIIVEVKRYGNNELVNRKVISQIIDYVSSLSSMHKDELLNVFSQSNYLTSTWNEFIQNMFPNDIKHEELANIFLKRIHNGDVNLVIACDKATADAVESVKSISKQSAIGFNLDLIEIQPFISEKSDDLIFIPHRKLETEIVGRTIVNVHYSTETNIPNISIETSSLEEIETNLKNINQIENRGKIWSDDEIYETIKNGDEPIAIELIEFSRTHSVNNRFTAPGKKQYASFGYYLSGKTEKDGTVERQIFRYDENGQNLFFYLNSVSYISQPNVYNEYIEKLNKLFEGNLNINLKEPRIGVSYISDKIDQFKDIMLWLKANLS